MSLLLAPARGLPVTGLRQSSSTIAAISSGTWMNHSTGRIAFRGRPTLRGIAYSLMKGKSGDREKESRNQPATELVAEFQIVCLEDDHGAVDATGIEDG